MYKLTLDFADGTQKVFHDVDRFKFYNTRIYVWTKVLRTSQYDKTYTYTTYLPTRCSNKGLINTKVEIIP